MSDTIEPTEAEASVLAELFSTTRRQSNLAILRAYRDAEVAKATEEMDWLSEHPEHMPYLEDGIWRIPYLVNGDGGFGGGVGQYTHRTLRGVIAVARAQQKDTP